MKLDKEIKQKINYLFYILDKNNIKALDVNFYGGGDDGNMDVSNIEDKSSLPGKYNEGKLDLSEPTIFDSSLEELIFDISDNLLNLKNVDYCNGMGNNGYVIFDVLDKEVKMNYQVIEDAHCSLKL